MKSYQLKMALWFGLLLALIISVYFNVATKGCQVDEMNKTIVKLNNTVRRLRSNISWYQDRCICPKEASKGARIR